MTDDEAARVGAAVTRMLDIAQELIVLSRDVTLGRPIDALSDQTCYLLGRMAALALKLADLLGNDLERAGRSGIKPE